MNARKRTVPVVPAYALGLLLGLWASGIAVACGGSSSETPYPLEPRPHKVGMGGASSK